MSKSKSHGRPTDKAKPKVSNKISTWISFLFVLNHEMIINWDVMMQNKTAIPDKLAQTYSSKLQGNW